MITREEAIKVTQQAAKINAERVKAEVQYTLETIEKSIVEAAKKGWSRVSISLSDIEIKPLVLASLHAAGFSTNLQTAHIFTVSWTN